MQQAVDLRVLAGALNWKTQTYTTKTKIKFQNKELKIPTKHLHLTLENCPKSISAAA